jgi:alginate O-acetyltransferase complex protein AlgI
MGFLGLASLGYLASLEPWGTLVLAAWTTAFYWLPRSVGEPRSRRRAGVVLILGILGYLAYFKYVPPLLHALHLGSGTAQFALPLGISYFTFKFIHYVIELNRGTLKPHGFADFLCYVFLVPIFTAGPIERFDHFLAHRERAWSLQSTVEGLTRIIHGLIKRFAISALLVAPLMGSVDSTEKLLQFLGVMSPLRLWWHLFVSFLLFYLDFSAYSDIAIGASRLFGLRIIENFNWPIVAPSIVQFWKRWHMSLAGWCQSYIYMPMIGLTRNPYVASYAAFFIIGLWHGGSWGWILWGLYHGTGIAAYVFWSQLKRRRKWKIPDVGLTRLAGIALTLAFVSAAGVLPALDMVGASPWDALRVYAKLLFLNLPEHSSGSWSLNPS